MSVYGKLEDFVLNGAESFDQALTRAIDWHIHDYSFTDIYRHVSTLFASRHQADNVRFSFVSFLKRVDSFFISIAALMLAA